MADFTRLSPFRVLHVRRTPPGFLHHGDGTAEGDGEAEFAHMEGLLQLTHGVYACPAEGINGLALVANRDEPAIADKASQHSVVERG